MKKILLGGAAAFVMAAFAFAGSASAACWWNGLYWQCYGGYTSPPSYDNNWGNFAPNWYEAHPGNKPDWLPSYPGPKPSGGAGR